MKKVKSLQCFVEKLEENFIKTINHFRTQYNVITDMQNYVCGNRLKRKRPKRMCIHNNFLRQKGGAEGAGAVNKPKKAWFKD